MELKVFMRLLLASTTFAKALELSTRKIELPIWRRSDDGKNDLNEIIISDKKGNSFDIGEALRNNTQF